MRTSSPFFITTVVAFLLAGCTTSGQSTPQVAANFINRQHVTPTTQEIFSAKNPATVATYNQDKTPHAPYRVIGIATIAKKNILGMPRHEKTLNEMMKKLAASIGGDGIMNVKTNDEHMEAHVIAFQKIMI